MKTELLGATANQYFILPLLHIQYLQRARLFLQHTVTNLHHFFVHLITIAKNYGFYYILKVRRIWIKVREQIVEQDFGNKLKFLY